MHEERISLYASTRLVFSGEPPLTVDLRRPVDDTVVAALADRELAGPFGVITAENPYGEDRDASENAELRQELKAELRHRGVSHCVPLDGCSPDLQHCEASLAVRLPQNELIQMARRFHQEAIFWFDGARFWIVGAVLEIKPVPLPLSLDGQEASR